MDEKVAFVITLLVGLVGAQDMRCVLGPYYKM